MAQKLATGGIVSIQTAPIGILSGATVWSEPFYTTKDSLNFAQAEATKNNIYIDQKDLPVYTSSVANPIVLSGVIPDTAATFLKWARDYTATDPYAPVTHTATGMIISAKKVNLMFRINFDSLESVIITNGMFVSNMSGASLSTTALGHAFTVTAQAGLGGVLGEEADFVFWNKN